MADKTGIGWTTYTWNPWWACRKKTEECRHCYISRFIKWQGIEPFDGPRLTSESTFRRPYAWNRNAARTGQRAYVFTCSMSDFFEEDADPWRPAAWQVMRECSNLDWLVLTKNAMRIADQLPPDWGDGYPNVYLGVTVGIESSMWRIPYLLDVPAKVRFISAEPLLGPLDFRPYLHGIHWIITGCESGRKIKKGEDENKGRRPMQLDWVRDIDRQCREAGIAHFFKQRYDDDNKKLIKDGVLDGVVRQEWPVVRR